MNKESAPTGSSFRRLAFFNGCVKSFVRLQTNLLLVLPCLLTPSLGYALSDSKNVKEGKDQSAKRESQRLTEEKSLTDQSEFFFGLSVGEFLFPQLRRSLGLQVGGTVAKNLEALAFVKSDPGFRPFLSGLNQQGQREFLVSQAGLQMRYAPLEGSFFVSLAGLVEEEAGYHYAGTGNPNSRFYNSPILENFCHRRAIVNIGLGNNWHVWKGLMIGAEWLALGRSWNIETVLEREKRAGFSDAEIAEPTAAKDWQVIYQSGIQLLISYHL